MLILLRTEATRISRTRMAAMTENEGSGRCSDDGWPEEFFGCMGTIDDETFREPERRPNSASELKRYEEILRALDESDER